MWGALIQRETVAACALTLVAMRPPQVVETSPAHGSAGVDPETREIVARFDTPMAPGFSWVGGGPMFPEITGSATWIDPTTATLPVRLKPDHDYVLRLNGGRFRNFASAQGEPLEPTTIAFSTRAMPTTPGTNREAFDRLREAVLHHYSHRDRLGVDWDAHLQAVRDEILASDSTLRLATRLAEALRVAEDMHISVRLGPWVFGTHAPAVTPNFDFRVADLGVGGMRKEGEGVFSARLEDGTAYLLVTSWDRRLRPGKTAADALKDMLDAPRLIIDVRPNGGGDELEAQALASCLVGEPVIYARSLNIDPERPGEFLGPFDRVLTPSADGTPFLGPVCVLMGRACMSSNEAFLLMARAAGATLVGQPSFGSSGNPRAYDLGEGITLLLPSWQSLTPEGESFEGVGIRPDLPVEQAPRSGGARDPVIEAAIEHLESASP